MKIKALAPWFGNCRMLAQTVGRELGKLDWCGVPFCGGCPELPYIKTRGGVANDLHRDIINLARVIRNPVAREELLLKLSGLLFHPDELAGAQERCRDRDLPSAPFFPSSEQIGDQPDVQWACDYFVCCWMGRGGFAGKENEFDQTLSLRWTSSGGDSARRFRSAIESLDAWHLALRPWSFSTLDVFDFLNNCKDQAGHGLYVDAPWPGAGEGYRHQFTDDSQRQLATELGRFRKTRVVIRYGDHPLIRELYPEDTWTWRTQNGRNQRNGEVKEVLIVNNRNEARASNG